MKFSRTTIQPLVLACSLVLTACGGGGGGGSDPGVTSITGMAEAPSGMVAQFDTNKSIMVALTEFVFPGAYAAISGLMPVTGATVELIRIDDDGNQVGAVLASTVTSITGEYSLALPTGVSLAGDLVVRITGSSATMSAMVVQQSVDINPVSEYVLNKFVDDPSLVLADLATNEVVALQGKVDEFDLTATSDLSSMLAQLDAEVGQLVDDEIQVLNSTPDDGSATTAVAGTWNTMEIGLGMHDSEQVDYGTLALQVYSEPVTVTAGTSAGEINLAFGAPLIDSWSNLSIDSMGFASIYHQTNIDGGGDSIPAQIDADGNIIVETPFEEELETPAPGDLDGPDFGWRWPSNTIIVRDTGNNNTKVLVGVDAGVRYATTDTNSDGIKDAIDPNAKSGDEVEMRITMLLKEGSGMSVSSLNGDYGILSISADLNTTPEGQTNSTLGVVNFDGSGTASVAANAFEDLGFLRSVNSFPTMTLTDNSGLSGGFSFPYSVSTTGQLIFDIDNDSVVDDPDDLDGFSNDDGSVLALYDLSTTGSPTITSVYNEMIVAVKLPTSQPAMGNAVYKLYPMVFGAEESGRMELVSLRNVSSLTFDAGATAATADFTARGFERDNDIAAVNALVDPNDPAFDFTVDSIGTNGAIEMTYTSGNQTSKLKGFVSADGKLMVLRYNESDVTVSAGYRGLGMVIAIKQ